MIRLPLQNRAISIYSMLNHGRPRAPGSIRRAPGSRRHDLCAIIVSQKPINARWLPLLAPMPCPITVKLALSILPD
jgi:hypothetical protein